LCLPLDRVSFGGRPLVMKKTSQWCFNIISWICRTAVSRIGASVVQKSRVDQNVTPNSIVAAPPSRGVDGSDGGLTSGLVAGIAGAVRHGRPKGGLPRRGMPT
jgi:hypothetical protein